MKRKIFKFGLPLMAFMVAGAMSVASVNESTAEAPLATTGYIWQNGVCTPNAKVCNELPGGLCTTDIGSFPIYRNQTVCTSQLMHRIP